jgi:hypothetical protein
MNHNTQLHPASGNQSHVTNKLLNGFIQVAEAGSTQLTSKAKTVAN